MHGSRPREQACNGYVAEYLNPAASVTTHAKPVGVFWWTYNFHSGGPGGLTFFHGGFDQSKEGINIKWYKVEYMRRITDMRPWYEPA
jgi:hypothetical protein